MGNSLIDQSFKNAKKENRPALLTYTVAGDNTKKKSFEILIANTIKGKGIKIIENDPAWHHRAPTKKELEIFKKELDI